MCVQIHPMTSECDGLVVVVQVTLVIIECDTSAVTASAVSSVHQSYCCLLLDGAKG